MNIPNVNNAISFEDKSIGTIYITGGGLYKEPFTGIDPASRFGWKELVWKTSPSRGGDFAFSNMDNIDVGLVARCEINIKYMDIDKYMKLRKAVARERYFWVDFFDIDEGKWQHREMYCSENTTSKFLMLKKHLIGHMDFALKFVGTNRDVGAPSVTVNYYSSYPSGALIETKTVSWGDQIKTVSDSVLTQPTTGTVLYWNRYNVNGDKIGVYGANQSTTVWESMNLYASWEKPKE